MKYFILFISLLKVACTYAQQNSEISTDTIYLNTLWKKCPKEDAESYRIISNHGSDYLVTDFYPNSDLPKLVAICSKADTTKNGYATYFFESGKKSHEGNYKKGKMTGKWILWEEENNDSSTIECFEDGTYKNIALSKTRITLYNKYDVFYKIEEPAEFPKGENAMLRWITNQIDKRGYPEKEKRNEISGTCYANFTVETDGRLTDIHIFKGVPKGPGYDQLVMDIIMEMPAWKPGMLYGRPVKVQFNLPMRFVLK